MEKTFRDVNKQILEKEEKQNNIFFQYKLYFLEKNFYLIAD